MNVNVPSSFGDVWGIPAATLKGRTHFRRITRWGEGGAVNSNTIKNVLCADKSSKNLKLAKASGSTTNMSTTLESCEIGKSSILLGNPDYN